MIKSCFKFYAAYPKTPHTVIVSLGLFVGLCYLPSWIRFLVLQIYQYGSGSFTLAVCLAAIGIIKLWQNRYSLAVVDSLEADRWLGHCLIVVGILSFPFCRFSLWSQAFLWLFILIGVVISCWGIAFFSTYSGISWAFALSVYPNPGHIAGTLWQTLLPARILESSMAWVTTTVLRWVGQPVVVSGPLVFFPHHTVEVSWGCNGFDTALAMLGASLCLGWYLGFSNYKIFQLSFIGIVLAFLVNIPRLVLMALAAAYWGADIFDFLHGPWGGQIFVTVLLGGYYYLALRLSPASEGS
ncbi:cyanoexosortase C [Nodosilinea sp. E11]|uniref:cyanoexosortase C n=1 Tax=Nodosilinea sp. E11 TaxID=3037479 RepID=UPI0029342F3C|nr:cyanoexosortase C [Nodosilinea sp. E11]WOD37913.1 cyanoexosortase C [Nodosilinea sp. E11]